MLNISLFAKYPVVFPHAGDTLAIRLLFCPTSGTIFCSADRRELIEASEITENSALKDYIMANDSKLFDICYAQFISSTSNYQNKYQTIKNGDIVLLVFPNTAIKKINRLIRKYCKMPNGFDLAFCHSKTGLCVFCNVSNSNKHSISEIANAEIETEVTDIEFMLFLDRLDNLYRNEQNNE